MRYGILIYFILLVFTFFGCDEDPASIGNSLLPDSDKISLDSVDNSSGILNLQMNDYQSDIDLGASPYFLIGKNDEMNISGLLRFSVSLPDSVVNSYNYDQLKVNKAWIEFYPQYNLGETDLQFEMEVYKINSYWQPSYFDDGSFSIESFRSEIDFSENLIIQNLEFSDSLYKIEFNRSLTESWIFAAAEDDTTQNYGIYIQPSFSTQRIMGFGALSSYLDEDDSRLYVEVEDPDTFIDTLVFYPFMDIHQFEFNDIPHENHYTLLQAGKAYRGAISFNLDFLKEATIINQAELGIFVDTLISSFGVPSSDTIHVRMFTDNYISNDTVSSEYGLLALIRENDKYSGKITNFIQRFVSGTENFGLRLQLSDENRSASKIFLFNTNAESVKKPTFTIKYSKLQ